MAKNNQEEVRVSLTTSHGVDLIDVRTFTRPVGSRGEMVPTKRGICLCRDRLPALITALIQAQEGGAC
ncbi:PC4/YdbC family ssDNA-binding protein [Methylobacterium sp. J-076]|uniref:PC4/YdbC family ssDNA-binding protein n=1 Tax=Methylobacterium sp. J-076 TaxID=2836655 RepID=UPI001FB9B91F|nr:PC4/YdbC family ssDNA-binding protein [Methylobacterium sp. J-076]MCJ2014535.1 transcriptional coactivator p15/PC4 family protein [Methylobacterium sp. J-076]